MLKKLLLWLSVFSVLTLVSCSTAEYEYAVIDGTTRSDAVITVRKNKQALTEYYPGAQQVAIYTEECDIIYSAAVDVQLHNNGTVTADGKNYHAIEGLLVDPPAATNRDVFYLMVNKLDAGEKVLFLYLDGFGYDTYEKALASGLIPALAGLNSEPAIACMPSITPVNYAAMVSGQTPMMNGVDERGDHQLSVETIFDYCADHGHQAIIIEGNSEILSFCQSQKLNPDEDGDGDTDDEVFAAALLSAEQVDCDLLFVHFHGIDDMEHDYGPYSDAAYARVTQTDSQITALLDIWDGSVIVCADHGQHQTEDGGRHGEFRASDLFVPLLQN